MNSAAPPVLCGAVQGEGAAGDPQFNIGAGMNSAAVSCGDVAFKLGVLNSDLGIILGVDGAPTMPLCTGGLPILHCAPMHLKRRPAACAVRKAPCLVRVEYFAVAAQDNGLAAEVALLPAADGSHGERFA